MVGLVISLPSKVTDLHEADGSSMNEIRHNVGDQKEIHDFDGLAS